MTQLVSSQAAMGFMAAEIKRRQSEIRIARDQAKFVQGSHVAVNVDRRFSTVHILDLNDESLDVFLQGSDADEFIDAADDLYECLGEITMEQAYQVQAHPYLDLMV